MKVFYVLLGALLLAYVACAEDVVVSNSAHGIDVISSISYANAKDVDFQFLVTQQGAAENVLKVGSGKEVLLIQSDVNPVSATLVNDLETRGNTVETITSSDPLATNLELAERSGATKFIIVDTTYGYNAVSVMPYAAITKAFIIMADADNAQDVAVFVKGAGAQSVIQYGYLDDAVKTALGNSITEVIDTGSKYQDNLKIVGKYLEETGTKQAILADGSFIEASMAKGDDPVILISALIPNEVRDYILNSGINTLVLIGGDLAAAVDSMRQSLKNSGKEVSVFVKFGQATPGLDTGVKQLDTFPMPSYPLDLTIKSVSYNEAGSVLEVTYTNNVNAVAYVMANIDIKVGGQTVRTIGDTEPLLVTKSGEKGAQYALDLAGLEGDIYAEVRAKYGTTPTSFEKVAAGSYLVTKISIADNSALNVTRLFYDKSAKQLLLTVKNTGAVDVYYLPKFDLQTKDGAKEFTPEVVQSLSAGKSKDVIFSGVELSDSEVKQNAQVAVHVDYGSREAFLTKLVDKALALEVSKVEGGGDYTTLIVALVIVVCALLAVMALKKKKGKRR